MEDITLNKNNIILLEIGIETNKLWNNETQRKVFLKSLYSYTLANNFSEEYIRKFSSKIGIDRDLCVDLLRQYIKELPIESRPNIKMKNGKYIIEKSERGTMEKVYDELAKLRTEKEVKDFFSKYELYKNRILNEFHRYRALYIDMYAEQIENNIKLYKKYLYDLEVNKYKSEKAKYAYSRRDINEKGNPNKNGKSYDEIEKEIRVNKEHAIKIVKLVVDSKTNHICNLLQKNGISKYDFKRYLETVRVEDNNLYKRFSLRRTKIITEVLNKMKNPIIENGIERPFDIIDYLLITDIEPNDLAGFATSQNSLLLKKFYLKNIFSFKDDDKFEETVYKDLVLFDAQNAKFDDKGNYIEGTARKLTDEEKQKFIEFLEKNNIYKNIGTYNALKTRYRKGYEIPNVKKLVIKR